MPDKHLSSQFDHELNDVSSRLMELGGLVESQIQQAVYALSLFVEDVADRVIQCESQVNALEVEIDRELSSIIARRQPTAIDLRLLMAISKATANLERAGDEANKIARMVKSLIHTDDAAAAVLHVLRDMLAYPQPSLVPPEPLLRIGATLRLGWEQFRAGREV